MINIYQKNLEISIFRRGRRSRDRMLVGFSTTCAINAYHH